MKSYWFIFVLIAISNTAIAQLDKGTWMAGATGSFLATSSTFKNPAVYLASDRVDISISAHLGFFIFDKLAAGLKPSYEKYKEISDDVAYSNTSRYGLLGPFARYYFLNKDNQFNILTDVSYQYGLCRFKSSKGNINTFSANAGLTGFFNTSVGIEFLAGYYFRKEATNDHISMKKGFQMSVGFQFYLEK